MKLQAPSLENLITQWERDSVIDQTEPGKEIVRIPLLHNQFNKYMALHNLATKRAILEYDRVKKLKWLYYSGKLDQSDLDKLGWEPFRFTLKSDISVYIDGDDDLIKLKTKKAYHEEAANFCVNVMKELNNRTWQLKEFIGWEKFIQGQH
jgi:hypothetical protein